MHLLVRNFLQASAVKGLNIVSKVFTVVLSKRLDTWAEKEDKMSKEQVNMLKSVYIIHLSRHV